MESTFSIQELINAKVREREEKEITSFHCSKLGSCLTGVYLQRSGVKPDEEFDDRTLRVFSAGKLFEEWIVGLVEASGATIEKQVRVEDKELNFSGYADFVWDTGEKKIVYEVKSKNSKAFWYMKDKGEGANRHHEMQLWLYLYNLGIEDGRLLYVEKDALSILEYPVQLSDEKLRDEVMEELDILNRAWKEQLPPPVPEDLIKWKATYCSYHKSCVSQKTYLTL